jgi:excisionase family DNA binding protein
MSANGDSVRSAASTPAPFGADERSIRLDVPPEIIEAVARRAAEIVAAEQSSAVSPWLSTEQAAEYIAAKPARVHDLVALGKLTPRRDGRRLLFKRSDLDAYVEGSA